ncbi:MAG: DNA polymerase III subunit delta [Planctomycetota bacterium]
MAKTATTNTAGTTVKPGLPVYALVGEVPFLQQQSLAAITATLSDEPQRIDVDGERAGLAEVLDELRSFAMFGGEKLVVVRDADEFISKHRPQLEDYVAAPADSGTLVLRCRSLPGNQRIAKSIAKVGQVIKCEPPKERELPAWIEQRARTAHGLEMDRDAADLLADLIGAELGRIDNELAKLALNVDGPVTAQTIRAGGVAFQREQQMWSMTDALSSGDTAEAVRRWRQLQQTDSSAAFRAVTWLAIWVEKATAARRMKLRSNASDFAIGKELRIWPASNVGPLLAQAETMGDVGLRRALDQLALLDRRIKTGFANVGPAVERFLVTL